MAGPICLTVYSKLVVCNSIPIRSIYRTSRGPAGRHRWGRHHTTIGALMTTQNRFVRPSISIDARVRRVELLLLHLPIREALDAAHGATTGPVRELAVIGLEGDNGVVGWGECAALATGDYWPETAMSSYELLGDLSTDLTGRSVNELIGPDGLGVFADEDRPMAAAAVEMAAFDLALKATGRSLGFWIGTTRRQVRAGAAVGLGTPERVAERVARLADDGYRRVKVKIEPGSAAATTAAVVDRMDTVIDNRGGFDLHLDANGSFSATVDTTGTADTAGAVDALVGLASMGVRAIEQPFAPADASTSRSLRAALADAGLATLVMADESATSVAAARESVTTGEADGVVVKPARLGGILAARAAIADAEANRAAVAIGGMVESALGRHSLAALAGLDEVTVTGDLSPAGRWLQADPWPDLTTSTIDGVLHVVVPKTPGVAPPPDPELLERFTVERTAVGR